MNLGLDKSDLKMIIEKLNMILSDTYILYTKTQGFHWNVKGIHFGPLHELFGTLYERLLPAIDQIAERVRTLGAPAPGSIKQILSLSTLTESSETLNEKKMLQVLLVDHETLTRNIRTAINEFADTADEGTIDLLVERLQDHEKTAWMLRSYLE